MQLNWFGSSWNPRPSQFQAILGQLKVMNLWFPFRSQCARMLEKKRTLLQRDEHVLVQCQASIHRTRSILPWEMRWIWFHHTATISRHSFTLTNNSETRSCLDGRDDPAAFHLCPFEWHLYDQFNLLTTKNMHIIKFNASQRLGQDGLDQNSSQTLSKETQRRGSMCAYFKIISYFSGRWVRQSCSWSHCVPDKQWCSVFCLRRPLVQNTLLPVAGIDSLV